MAISKTGIHVDESSSFNNPLVYEENGQVNSVVADSLTPDTRYYTRGYVVSDGTTVYSGNVRSFKTEQPDYLTFANPNNSDITLTLTKRGTPTTDIKLETTLDDGTTWTNVDFTGVNSQSWLIPAGKKLKFRGNNNSFSSSPNNDFYKFICPDTCNISGNVMTLLDKTGSLTTIPCDYCFVRLFEANSGGHFVNDGIKLPATTLTQGCYYGMFFYQLDLGQAPELPALTMQRLCYSAMFMNTRFTQAPTLPATTLAEECYSSMFANNINLTTAPALNSMHLVRDCYSQMFYGCSSLQVAPALPATTLAYACYSNMFEGCTSLVDGPDLPATTPEQICYQYMYKNCSSLRSIRVHLNTLTGNCIREWCDGAGSGSGDFYNLGGATFPSGISGIPVGWTEINSI